MLVKQGEPMLASLPFQPFSLFLLTIYVGRVGLWRSWERACMACRRSPVQSRPAPPNQARHVVQRLFPISAPRFWRD